VTVASATLVAGQSHIVDLVTSAQTPGATYTLTVNGVRDASTAGNTIAAGTPTTLGCVAGRFDTRTIFPNDSHENYLASSRSLLSPRRRPSARQG